MAYNTGNPIGSTDPRDAADNKENFDRFALSAARTYTDRLGVQRKTVTGALQDYAAYNLRGAWTAATAYNVNDVWRDGPTGAFYLVLADYTSGASAAADIAGGNVTVQQPKDWVVSANTIADLRNLEPAFDGQQACIAKDGASGIFYADFTDSTSVDDGENLIVSSVGGIQYRWRRSYNGVFYVDKKSDLLNLKAADFSEGSLVCVRDLLNDGIDRGPTYWRFTSSPEVVSGQSSTAITFTDERVVRKAIDQYFVFDDSLNIGFIKALEKENYAKHLARIYSRDVTPTINCYGDSVTFGFAGESDPESIDLTGQPTGFGDGSVYTSWQKTGNWPAAVKTILDAHHPVAWEVNNLGFSGDRAYAGYLRHRTVRNKGVSIISYGVNEALYATTNGANLQAIRTDPVISVDKYVEAVRKFAIREILRGNSVLLISSNPYPGSNGWDGTNLSATKANRAYDLALKALAVELGVAYVDPKEEILRGYTVFNSDFPIHPNNSGYALIAAKYSGIMIGGHNAKRKVKAGDKIIVNPIVEPIYNSTAVGVTISSTATPGISAASPLNAQDPAILQIGSTPVLFSFYAEHDDMVVFPEGYIPTGATLTATLNNNAQMPEYLLDRTIGKPSEFRTVGSKPKPQKVKSGEARFVGQENVIVGNDDNFYIHLPAKGYYILSLTATGGAAFLSGLSFESYSEASSRPGMCVFEGGASSATILRSKYVKSVDRLGPGQYKITLSSTAVDANFSVIGMAQPVTASSTAERRVGSGVTGNSKTSDFFLINVKTEAGSLTDDFVVSLNILF